MEGGGGKERAVGIHVWSDPFASYHLSTLRCRLHLAIYVLI